MTPTGRASRNPFFERIELTAARQEDEVRCMKLNRFLRIEPTDVAYSIPKSFSLEKHLGNDWRRAQYPRGSRD